MSQLTEERMAVLAAEPMRFPGPPPAQLGGTITTIKDIWAHRQLLGLITRREIKARYKDSILGLFWTLIRPLVMIFVYWLVMGQFLGAERGIPDFAIYIAAGLAVWQLFSDIAMGGTGSIVANAGLIKKVYVPREIFPLSIVGSALFNFLMQLVILLIFTIARGSFPVLSRWYYFPLGVLLTVIWGTALALLLAASNVYLRDMQYLVELGITVFMWMSPIVYAWTFVKAEVPDIILRIYLLNPMTLAVLAFQRAFWAAIDRVPTNIEGVIYYLPQAPVPHFMLRIAAALIISTVLLWVAMRVFTRLQGNFAQEM